MTDLRIGFSKLIRRFSYVKKIYEQHHPLFYYMHYTVPRDDNPSIDDYGGSSDEI